MLTAVAATYRALRHHKTVGYQPLCYYQRCQHPPGTPINREPLDVQGRISISWDIIPLDNMPPAYTITLAAIGGERYMLSGHIWTTLVTRNADLGNVFPR